MSKTDSSITHLIKEFELRRVPLSIIKFDETNPNMMTRKQMTALILAMEKYGYLAPVIIDKDFRVIDGEHRVRVYQQLGKQEIPAYVVDIDHVEAKILRQLMNKLRGQHARDKDMAEYRAIHEAGRLEDLARHLAQTQTKYQAILERKLKIPILQPDNIPRTSNKYASQPGDIFQLGQHRLMCGDATNPEHIKALLNGAQPTMIFANPQHLVDDCNYLDYFFENFQDLEAIVLNGDQNTARMLLRYHEYFINFYIIELPNSQQTVNPDMLRISHKIATHYRKGKAISRNLETNLLPFNGSPSIIPA